MGLKRQRKVCRVGYKVKVVPAHGRSPPGHTMAGAGVRMWFEGQELGNGPKLWM